MVERLGRTPDGTAFEGVARLMRPRRSGGETESGGAFPQTVQKGRPVHRVRTRKKRWRIHVDAPPATEGAAQRKDSIIARKSSVETGTEVPLPASEESAFCAETGSLSAGISVLPFEKR